MSLEYAHNFRHEWPSILLSDPYSTIMKNVVRDVVFDDRLATIHAVVELDSADEARKVGSGMRISTRRHSCDAFCSYLSNEKVCG
jgi:hypothetical protein